VRWRSSRRPWWRRDAADLGLPAGSVVLVTRSLDTLTDGTPLQIGITRFVADRVEFDVAHADLELDELV
jgi:GntR family phosphonate transport system transcriptional regulator